MIKLREAIELYKKEKGSISNSYDWYRKSAVREGSVQIGDSNIKATKTKGTWYIDKDEFEDSIRSHRLYQKKIKQNSLDYENNIIHGLNTRIETDWGYYVNYGDFRLAVNHSDVLRNKNNGIWICNTCNQIAQQEHKKEECHLCSDWNGCSDDCTLSLVFCDKCKRELKR